MPPDLYTPHNDTIEAALAFTCRVNRLPADAGDEFRSWARLRLLDNGQAILRKFQGRSSLRTYLLTVVQRLYLDWRNAEWGKWRPSAEARRLGEVAVELERLVQRDRLAFSEAVQTLAARGLATAEESEAMWRRLPRRPHRRRVDDQALAAVPADGTAGDRIDADELDAAATRIAVALEAALMALPPADRVLLQLRYWSGVTVSRIAVLTGEDQKALYRRFDRLAADLRRQLEAQGIRGPSLAEVLGRMDATLTPVDEREFASILESVGGRPSTPVDPGDDHE